MRCVRLLEKELCYPNRHTNQSRERTEKIYALYFKSETWRDQLRFSEDVVLDAPLIYTLPGRASCGCIFSAVECVLLIFQWGGWV